MTATLALGLYDESPVIDWRVLTHSNIESEAGANIETGGERYQRRCWMHAIAVLENEVKSRWKGMVGKVAIQQWRNKSYFGDSKQPSFDDSKQPCIDDSEKHRGMCVSGRMEVSVKFSEKPRSTLAEDGKVHIEIECNGKTIRVGLKPKSWRKAAALMDQYPLWVACVSGKMAAMDATGMALEGAGIQVFEKQAKSGDGS